MITEQHLHQHPFYIIGPYKYGPFSIPRINLITYIITLFLYTAILPFLSQINRRYFQLPSLVIYGLYFVYAMVLFYFFGVVTIGYIIYQNTKAVGNALYEHRPNIHLPNMSNTFT